MQNNPKLNEHEKLRLQKKNENRQWIIRAKNLGAKGYEEIRAIIKILKKEA